MTRRANKICWKLSTRKQMIVSVLFIRHEGWTEEIIRRQILSIRWSLVVSVRVVPFIALSQYIKFVIIIISIGALIVY